MKNLRPYKMTLQEICTKHKRGLWPDKGDVHSYLNWYATALEKYRHTAQNVLEIGLMSGESLRMWAEYFSGTVYGMDIAVKPIDGMADLTNCIAEGYNVCIGNAADPVTVKKYFDRVKFDVIIEDAGHHIEQQLQMYKVFKPYLAEGAIYIIEDVQDIDATRHLFETIDSEKTVEIYDFRQVKGRYDDVLVVVW